LRAHRAPVVERVAPELADRAERVGRSPGDVPALKQLGMGGDVGAAPGDVDRDVAEQPDAALGGIVAQRAPLAVEPHLVGDRVVAGERRPVRDPVALADDERLELFGGDRRPRLLEVAAVRREGGCRRVRRAGPVRRPEREQRPPRLTRLREPVDEAIRLAPEFPARERGHVQQHAAGPPNPHTFHAMPLLPTKPPRIQIEDVWPQLDCGRYPVTRSVGDDVEVWATIFRDGHDVLGAAILYRAPGASSWQEAPMRRTHQPDRWTGYFQVDACGRWEFTIDAWVDRLASWRDELRRKVEAGQTDLASELQEGAALLGVRKLDVETALASTESDRSEPTRLVRSLAVDADRKLARVGAWYELFPRSWGGFKGVEQVLPDLAELGFDVVYFPPIHPIGQTNRKGRNNALTAAKGDPGSPWAIGSEDGGHTAV